MLLAHEVEGTATAELATRRGKTPRRDRRAAQSQSGRPRVEYLLADGGITPPTDAADRCCMRFRREIIAGSTNLMPRDMSWNATVAWC